LIAVLDLCAAGVGRANPPEHLAASREPPEKGKQGGNAI
jgi:hypothetical protein